VLHWAFRRREEPHGTPHRDLRYRRGNISTESHVIDTLGIDSLDPRRPPAPSIRPSRARPLVKWVQEINHGKATTDQYPALGKLYARSDELIAGKG
jgi:hypothetical protein